MTPRTWDFPMPGPGPTGVSYDGPGAPELNIRQRPVVWNATGPDVDLVHSVQVQAYVPTLIRLCDLTPAGGPPVGVHLEASYRRWSDTSGIPEPLNLSLVGVPFAGPYAYLDVPGEYELLLSVETSSAPEEVSLEIAEVTGLPPTMIAALLDSGRVHRTFSGLLTTGVAGTINLMDGASIPALKYLHVVNAGTNPAIMSIGAGDPTVGITLPPSTSGANYNNRYGPELLGRDTIRFHSVAGTSLYVWAGMW